MYVPITTTSTGHIKRVLLHVSTISIYRYIYTNAVYPIVGRYLLPFVGHSSTIVGKIR